MPSHTFAYYQEAAAAGSETARLRVGEMLIRGQGVEQDVQGGRRIVREMADAGNRNALILLGDLYSRGDAGPIDGPAAVAAYQKAAALGDTQALMRLADLHYYAKAGRADLARAFKLYRQAAAAGLEAATLRVGEMLARGQGVPQDVDAGRAHDTRACRLWRSYRPRGAWRPLQPRQRGSDRCRDSSRGVRTG